MLTTRNCQSVLRNIAGLVLSHARLSAQKFSTSSKLRANFYDTLGLTPHATQTDIKAAYYKLSMVYHPDKNESDASAEKFRDIAEAYEVLGNYKSRKLYDKGMTHNTRSPYSHVHPRNPDDPVEVENEPDDAQTRFYKAHMKKSNVPHPSGRTPIYDFDEWSRAHYGSSFERRKTAKERFNDLAEEKRTDATAIQKEILLFSMIIFLALLGVGLKQEWSLDAVTVKSPTPVIQNDVKRAPETGPRN